MQMNCHCTDITSFVDISIVDECIVFDTSKKSNETILKYNKTNLGAN